MSISSSTMTTGGTGSGVTGVGVSGQPDKRKAEISRAYRDMASATPKTGFYFSALSCTMNENRIIGGYINDPALGPGDPPDHYYEELQRLLSAASPGDVDLRGHCTDTDQGGLPSCVGNAAADSIEIISSILGFPKVELSRRFLWTAARNKMQKDGHKFKTGTYIRLAFEVLRERGICLEKYMPYDVSKWDEDVPLTVWQKAGARKIKQMYRIEGTEDKRCQLIVEALRANCPVVFGTQVGSKFPSHKGTSVIDAPLDSIGGHAMVIVGYDRKGFLVKNSWGPGWGDGGYAYFTPKYIGWYKTKDIWVPTVGKDFNLKND